MAVKKLPTLLIGAAVMICGALPWRAALADEGTWQKHQYSFQFMGFTTTYSCDGLAGKLKTLLIAAGARRDAKSWPGACSRGFGSPDKFAQATLTFYTLAPAGADKTDDAPRVPGAWRAVAFAARSPRELALGDCELVEQFRNQVLPMFAARNIDDHTTCVPHQESGTVINLNFETFAAVSAKPAAAH